MKARRTTGSSGSGPAIDKPTRAVLLVCAGFTFIPFSYFYFIPPGYRYGVPFYITLLFVTVFLHRLVLSRRKTALLYNAAALAFIGALCEQEGGVSLNYLLRPAALGALAAIAAASLDPEARRRPAELLGISVTIALTCVQSGPYFYRGVNPSYSQWNAIWNGIYRQTGWTYEEARARTFFVGHHIEQWGEPVYREIARQTPAPRPSGLEIPDGYFVSNQYPMGVNVSTWLSVLPIQIDIKDGLRDGSIVIGKPVMDPEILIAPYYVRKHDNLPAHFQDSGEGYERTAAEIALLERPIHRAQAYRRADGTIVFLWNECPDLNPYCQTAIVTQWQPSPERGMRRLSVNVIGAPLSQSSPWISPDWTESWNEPYVRVSCRSFDRKWVLASSIGYSQKYTSRGGYGLFYGQNSFLAPFEREFDVPCDPGHSVIEAGRSSSVVERLRATDTLPSAKLVFP